METTDRKRFFEILGKTLIPQLRADGFYGSGASYRRFRDPVIQVINFQGSRCGGLFCVNLGIHLAFLPAALGELPNPKSLCEMDCEFRNRLAPEGAGDRWWAYGIDESSAVESIASMAELFLKRGKPVFDKWIDFPGRFANVTVANLEDQRSDQLPGGTSTVRAALTFARIQTHLNEPEKARAFASFGLANGARALRTDLERIVDGTGKLRPC